MHKESVILLANPVYGWEQQKEYIWQDDAACAFQPPTMFEVAFPGDPIAEADKWNDINDLNEANLQAAQKICNGCPVWDQCYTSAEPEDFEHTMRAGIMPTRHKNTPQGRPRSKHPLAIDTTKPCKEGHHDWKTSKGGGTYCGPCKVAYNKVANAKRPTKGRVVELITRGETCEFGHDSWVKNGKSAKGVQHYQCRPCKNERDRVRRANQRARLAG